MDLFWRERAALGNDDLRFFPSISARSTEPSFAPGLETHVGPVDMAGFDIDNDTSKSAIGDDDLQPEPSVFIE